MDVMTVTVESNENKLIHCDYLVYCFLFTGAVGVVNELCMRLSLCVKFVDRFQHNLKGRALTEPIRLVTFVETAVGLLNFKVNYKQNPPKTACVRHFAVSPLFTLD